MECRAATTHKHIEACALNRFDSPVWRHDAYIQNIDGIANQNGAFTQANKFSRFNKNTGVCSTSLCTSVSIRTCEFNIFIWCFAIHTHFQQATEKKRTEKKSSTNVHWSWKSERNRESNRKIFQYYYIFFPLLARHRHHTVVVCANARIHYVLLLNIMSRSIRITNTHTRAHSAHATTTQIHICVLQSMMSFFFFLLLLRVWHVRHSAGVCKCEFIQFIRCVVLLTDQRDMSFEYIYV